MGCACGSGIPISKVSIDGKTVELLALPLIFQQFRQLGRGPETLDEGGLLAMVKVYNQVAPELEERYHQRNSPRVRQVLSGGGEMSQTATYHTTVRWTGEHWGHLELGNGPEMKFSAPPDAQGHVGVLTPEDAFVAAANTCVMLMFIWAAERFQLNLRLV